MLGEFYFIFNVRHMYLILLMTEIIYDTLYMHELRLMWMSYINVESFIAGSATSPLQKTKGVEQLKVLHV